MGLTKLCLSLPWPRHRTRKASVVKSSPYDSQDSITIAEKPQYAGQPGKELTSERADAICNKISETYSELLKLANYEPGEQINKLLGHLVPLCTQNLDREVVQQIVQSARVQEILPPLRDICSQAESCFESYSAAKIIGDGKDDPKTALERAKSFRYYSNYVELAWFELCGIRAAGRETPKRIAFIGSGPLPLTSLCLLQELKKEADNESDAQGIKVLNVDCDQAAIDISRAMCHAVGEWSQGMEFLCAEAGSPEVDLTEYDVVYMAALVGVSQEKKEEITLKVVNSMRPGSLLVVRSAAGIRTCLYIEFDIATDRLLDKLEPCLTLHPHNEVVNSVIIARVKI
ncbi:Nicotianamine synthase 2 [Rhypophila decipiens]